jgi:hypothetical protein
MKKCRFSDDGLAIVQGYDVCAEIWKRKSAQGVDKFGNNWNRSQSSQRVFGSRFAKRLGSTLTGLH